MVAEVPVAGVSPGDTTRFTCKNCGATTNLVATGTSIHCPFCGSQYVIAKPDDPQTPRPEALIPFTVPDAQVQTSYREWLKPGFFQPRDLAALATNHKMRAVYLPVWECSGDASSEWTAMAGRIVSSGQPAIVEDGKTVVPAQNETIEWWPASGHHRDSYPRELISASKGLPQDWVRRLGDFDFGRQQTYNPQFLAGRETETPAMDEKTAIREARIQIAAKERSACAALVPGDRAKDLRVQTEITDVAARLLALPVWLASFQYKGKVYRCVINGQTGAISGEAPVSGTRVALVAAATIAAIVVIVLLARLLG